MDPVKIGKKIISNESKIFIVAELSANHNKDFSLAKETIYAMKESGADAVKLQTYTPDTITIKCNNKYFLTPRGLWEGKTLYELYEEAYTPWEWHGELIELATKLGMECFSSPFDKNAVDFLEKLGIPAFKIASPEIFDIPLIKYAASKKKPIIISTGIARICDVEEAVSVCRSVGNNKIILLKCTSSYPTPIHEVNLKTIPNMSETFNCFVGLSDHTLGVSVPITSVAMGVKIIEKHFILSKNISSPDREFSLDPKEFAFMVKCVREAEDALGRVTYELSENASQSRKYGRSLFVVKDIKKGEMFTEDNIKSIRPGFGLPPKFLADILGKKARKDLKKGTPLQWIHIDSYV